MKAIQAKRTSRRHGYKNWGPFTRIRLCPKDADHRRALQGIKKDRRNLIRHGGPCAQKLNEEHVTNKPTLALKCFFLAMAVGLVFSTLLGIYMAFKYNRSRALVWSMLLIGTAIPAGLLAMMG